MRSFASKLGDTPAGFVWQPRLGLRPRTIAVFMGRIHHIRPQINIYIKFQNAGLALTLFMGPIIFESWRISRVGQIKSEVCHTKNES